MQNKCDRNLPRRGFDVNQGKLVVNKMIYNILNTTTKEIYKNKRYITYNKEKGTQVII